jgi:poly-gamma-glutamate synthesis protein (capsule biosynthesis protein)
VRQLAESDEVDAVIATPHWGKEYAHEPQDKQRKLARQLVDAGATAVLGAHPHVLQPMEKLTAKDGREAFVIYSLGNFAHHQRSLDRRSSAILYLALRQREGGEVAVAGVGYVPIHVRMEGDKERFFVDAIDRAGGPADARAHVVGMLGEANVLPAEGALDLVPYCPERAPR